MYLLALGSFEIDFLLFIGNGLGLTFKKIKATHKRLRLKQFWLKKHRKQLQLLFSFLFDDIFIHIAIELYQFGVNLCESLSACIFH